MIATILVKFNFSILQILKKSRNKVCYKSETTAAFFLSGSFIQLYSSQSFAIGGPDNVQFGFAMYDIYLYSLQAFAVGGPDNVQFGLAMDAIEKAVKGCLA